MRNPKSIVADGPRTGKVGFDGLLPAAFRFVCSSPSILNELRREATNCR
jgi:hypothetical protein